MKVTKETCELAAEVWQYLVEHPESHDQGKWFEVNNEPLYDVVVEPNICGTTMCVSGTAVWIKNDYKIPREVRWSHDGAEALGLDEDEAEWLFYDADKEEAVAATLAIANGDQQTFDTLRGYVVD